jgi:hypothetical protein
MDEKPRRRWFRFSLVGLFALIALSAGLMRLWNPFAQIEPTWNNLEKLEPGMTVNEAQALVGKPLNIRGLRNQQFHVYRPDDITWVLIYVNGQFVASRKIGKPPPRSNLAETDH